MTAAKTPPNDELTVYVYMGKKGRETGFVPWRKAALPVRYLRADVVEKREQALREALHAVTELHVQPCECAGCAALAAADEGEAKSNE